MGVVSPIGIGKEPFWDALSTGRSGIGPLELSEMADLPVRLAAEVRDFAPKQFIANRKGLKVMSRDAQLGIAASLLACQDAGISAGGVDPERFGIVLGADRICGSVEESEEPYRRCLVDGQFDFSRWGSDGMAASFPLSFLRVLPNMIASHISITQDARGPNNTIHQSEVSSLLAVSEAARAIQRGAADVMMAGGASSQMNAFDWARYSILGRASRCGDPCAAPRPFDRNRDGEVIGEGAAVFILESLAHAEARGASILARILGFSGTGPTSRNGSERGQALRRAAIEALDRAGMNPAEVGHVNAHGVGTVEEDKTEAAVIRDLMADVPVTAPKSYFGNLGSAGGAMEMAVSLMALQKGLIPPTLHYERPDPQCPVNVVHGEPLPFSNRSALLINRTPVGQAAALVLGG
jgi:3-oxoacyl-[acyl-carrier-protein] synthase II